MTARPTPEEAAAERERRLELYTQVSEACTCTWPLDVRRNRSGHASDCPAHAIVIDHLERA